MVREARSGGHEALEAEIRREVAAYEAEGPGGRASGAGHVIVATDLREGRPDLADRLRRLAWGNPPEHHPLARLDGAIPRPPNRSADRAGPICARAGLVAGGDRVDARPVRRPRRGGRAGVPRPGRGGGLLPVAAGPPSGGPEHPHGPRLNPADLSARLPRTGAGDELDQLAATINDLLDRLADYHAQVIRFTADASHELRSPLGAMRARSRSPSAAPTRPRNTAMSCARWASNATGSPPSSTACCCSRGPMLARSISGASRWTCGVGRRGRRDVSAARRGARREPDLRHIVACACARRFVPAPAIGDEPRRQRDQVHRARAVA